MADLTMVVTPSGVSARSAAAAYQQTDGGGAAGPAGGAADGFGATLSRALDSAVQTGESADAQAAKAVAGSGNLTDVVAAVSQAQLALQTTVAIRDRVVEAYQEIMRMSI
jgi:flagellar hook-basal body complex protein FliE